jgi:hypothetical protein
MRDRRRSVAGGRHRFAGLRVHRLSRESVATAAFSLRMTGGAQPSDQRGDFGFGGLFPADVNQANGGGKYLPTYVRRALAVS